MDLDLEEPCMERLWNFGIVSKKDVRKFKCKEGRTKSSGPSLLIINSLWDPCT